MCPLGNIFIIGHLPRVQFFTVKMYKPFKFLIRGERPERDVSKTTVN